MREIVELAEKLGTNLRLGLSVFLNGDVMPCLDDIEERMARGERP